MFVYKSRPDFFDKGLQLSTLQIRKFQETKAKERRGVTVRNPLLA